MAPKSKSIKPETVKMSELVQFPLLPEEVEAVRHWSVTDTELMTLFAEQVAKGMRFEISPNNSGEGVSVLAKFAMPNHANSGFGFYANGKNLPLALAVLFVKLNIIGDNSLKDFLQSRGSGQEFS